MNIVVAVRCLNEEKNIARFMKGYSFADAIVVSDGGSKDSSLEMLKTYPKVHLHHFDGGETRSGYFWNTDNPHINHVINIAKTLNPDWLILDDMDDVPNYLLRENGRALLENCNESQANVYRLYLWGDTGNYFPHMNRDLHPDYTSLWAWRPDRIDIHADESVRHGTMVGLSPSFCRLEPPYCLLHKSWYPETVQNKVDRYNALGLPMNHPMQHPESFGYPSQLPEWAAE